MRARTRWAVVDAAGKVADRFEVTHSREGLAALIARLARHGPPDQTAVAIERPSGLVVDALLDAGFAVTPVHPNVVKGLPAPLPRRRGQERPRRRLHPGRHPAHRRPSVAPAHAAVGRHQGPARAGARARRSRRHARGARQPAHRPARRLLAGCRRHLRRRGESHRTRLPRPLPHARRRREARARAPGRLPRPAPVLRGRRTPEALLARLDAAPRGRAGAAECDAKGELVRALARALRALVGEIAKITGHIERMVGGLPDGRLVMSFPRAGKICAAQILAELGDVRGRYQTDDQLAAEAGVAPVTYASGKSRGVGWRWACNKRLRAALTCFADNSRHASPWAADVYRRARARGCDHPHAIRILARAWTRILWRAWTDREPYRPCRHAAASRLLTPADQMA